jgi:hypothetical protein
MEQLISGAIRPVSYDGRGGIGSGGPMPTNPPPASAGKKTVLSDRFMVGEELGRGAYGVVYKGMDLQTGDTVGPRSHVPMFT